MAPHPARPGATSEERFNFMSHGQPGGMAGGGLGAPAAGQGALAFDTPAGWEAKPDSSGMRLGSFGVAGHPDADCSIIVLPGGAGGVLANVDRWRKQMGLPPLEPGAEMKLPTVDLLGGKGLLVELEGSYAGMGGEAHAGYKMLGAIRAEEGASGPSLV
ncbi:MAG TPA: hypothetical protein VHF22_07480, partial [Planctomycetota bacterium]|nr:hypothetical protein [Planctomycetota bacterium]